MQMNENKPNNFVSKKCYEIAYAIFRIATPLTNRSLAENMEKQAVIILESGYSADMASVSAASVSAERLLRFGADVGLINKLNSDTVIEELKSLNSAIAALPELEPGYIDLDGIFSASEPPAKLQIKSGSEEYVQSFGNGTDKYQSHANHNGNDNNGSGNFFNAATRQSAVLERIRQNGNCRLKELQEFLPEVSERTLRYDIQNLIERGLVERYGGGGPGTYYRTKEGVSPPVTFTPKPTL